jgi:hypothetical protein
MPASDRPATGRSGAAQHAMVTGRVDENEFRKLVETRAHSLLALVSHFSQCSDPTDCLTRPLAGELLSQAMQLEELLDTYDAGKCCRWCNLRSLTAAFKLFADVGYELLHIRHRLPGYRLMPVAKDFTAATNETLEFTSDILLNTAREMVARARDLQLQIPPSDSIGEEYAEPQLVGHLPHDCAARRIETVAETVALLATSFLNLASETDDIRAAGRAKPEEYALCVAASLTEERLRSLEFRFHNLQSKYDTYVSGTEVERKDEDLPVLRGHASVVFHLLKIATSFAHYYERHVNKEACIAPPFAQRLITPETLLSVLMNYCVTFIDLYIGCTVSLCQEMLKRYAEVGRVEVGIPRYRGFHVRPSTLISKLVHHYGSKVQMALGDEIYDASLPLDLFRANEGINAKKRRWLANEIVRLELVPEGPDCEDVVSVVRRTVLALAQRSKLILYEQPLEIPEHTGSQEGTLLEKVIYETGRLLAMGKIDIETDMTAQFIGDKRVLADIRLLAEYGYGEDSFGNNIALPEKLSYLRR